MAEYAIAAAFFVDAKVVKQRRWLVTVVPVFLQHHVTDKMALEQS